MNKLLTHTSSSVEEKDTDTSVVGSIEEPSEQPEVKKEVIRTVREVFEDHSGELDLSDPIFECLVSEILNAPVSESIAEILKGKCEFLQNIIAAFNEKDRQMFMSDITELRISLHSTEAALNAVREELDLHMLLSSDFDKVPQTNVDELWME